MRLLTALAFAVAAALALTLSGSAAAGPHPWPPMPAVQPDFVEAPAYKPSSNGLRVGWLDESNAGAFALIALDEPQEIGPTSARPGNGQVALELPAGWAGRPLLAARVWYDEDGNAVWWDTQLVTRPQIYLPTIGTP
jgi:hypothetical protein